MPAVLTRREAEVVALLGEHLTHAEIADRLVLSVRTVESHVASARRKLQVVGHRELVRYAEEHRPRASRLPTTLSPFIGRAAERRRLLETVRSKRLVSLVGPGGAGKTRLAIELATAYADEVVGRVWLADLVPVTEPSAVAAAVVTACGVDHLPGRLPEDVLVRGLMGPAGLLVLDNCEHLLDPVALLVERLLSACPDLRVLVTSRARLALPFEEVHQVGGLAEDAVALFEQRAVAAGAQHLTEADRLRAEAICAAVGGLALAVELAAVQLPSHGLDGLERSLSAQVDLLVGGARLSPRQRSMAQTLDWSLRLVDPTARAVLSRVSCFAGGFGPDAATEVAGFDAVDPADVPRALANLVDQSLVVAQDGRWRLLEPVRQYAAGLDNANASSARTRHFAWAERTCSALCESGGTDASSTEVHALADEVRAAVAWATGARAPVPTRSDSARLLRTLGRLLFDSGAVRTAQDALERAAGLTDDPATRCEILAEAASVARCRDLGEEALRLDLAALTAARDTGDEAVVAARLASAAETLLRFEGMFSGPRPQDVTASVLAELEVLAPRQPAARTGVRLIDAGALDTRDPAAVIAAEDAVAAAELTSGAAVVSGALDVLTATQLLAGRVAEAGATAQRRVALLNGVPLIPAVALELKDGLHMAVFLACGTGDLTRAVSQAERHRDLPFLREQRDLAREDLLLPYALAGLWDELFDTAEDVYDDWVRSGRPGGAGRAIGPYAVSMVHGMLGHVDERRRWRGVVAALRDRPLAEAGRRTGYADVLDGLLLLHQGQPQQATRVLADHEAEDVWYHSLLSWWRAALRAEAAVLSGADDADTLLDAAATACASSEALTLIVARARALSQGSMRDGLADEFDRLHVPYQAQRTRLLAMSRA